MLCMKKGQSTVCFSRHVKHDHIFMKLLFARKLQKILIKFPFIFTLLSLDFLRNYMMKEQETCGSTTQVLSGASRRILPNLGQIHQSSMSLDV